ncbi:hypothetical protein DO021_20590 [Desulfobacter hydrogenophilus]|uniref:Glycosyltransferase family 2 protein n=1 Tax=Desulfobacter hydrogenophilus TaxID=2291 RepID=A0A328F6K8_9BACT|nr:glycosyltransferase family 2 protein [Desulfobacter hydrogenophilus]NDY74287.1 glycosyltransferase family 2 protein [Desulfobacter hydrogenophilus]QBH15072.1 glycosyltransferase family 2 protein [Desulfobacter hydrogenophilus]RAM00161.1 hypothetical protein DO021_20590 [Desulfobacter hydrogenophilus]
MPYFSVIMPVFNEEGNLANTISSVIEQSFGSFEYIIVNDGSIDGTLRELENYAFQDKRIKISSIKNSGISNALNNGIDAAIGQYIARIDAGDVANRHWLKTMYKYSRKNKSIDLFFGRVLITNERFQPFTIWPLFLPININQAILKNKNFPHPFLISKLKTIRDMGGYPNSDGFEDNHLWNKMIKNERKLYATKEISGQIVRNIGHNDIVEKRLKLRAKITGWSKRESDIVVMNAMLYRKIVYNTGLSPLAKTKLFKLRNKYAFRYIFGVFRFLLIKFFSVGSILFHRRRLGKTDGQKSF